MPAGFSATDEWRALARDPNVLYEILAWPGKESGWDESEFYAAGRDDWADFKRHWQHYDPQMGGTCVEIGCGAGRVTTPLAGDFERVVALDVSDDMIARARAVVPDHVEFARVDAPAIPLGDGEADGVFSVAVLQHLDTLAQVTAYLAEARRVLRPGGTIMVHVTMSSHQLGRVGRLRQAIELRQSRRSLARGGRHTVVRMRVYRWEEIYAVLARLGFADIELRMFPVRSNGYHHQFWMARVPASGSGDGTP